MIPRLWRPYVRVRQWWRDNRSLAETRDRAVRAEWECTRLRGAYEAAVDDAARQRLALEERVAAQDRELSTLRGHSALLLALLEIDSLPETQP